MAVDMFLKIKGVDGESMDKAHKGEMDVLEWSWDMAQSGTTHVGGGGGSGKVKVHDLRITKYVDAATNALMLGCCKGTHFDEAILVVRKAGDTPIEYIKLIMAEVMVTQLQTGSASTRDRLTETLALNFAEFRFEYQTQSTKGGKEGGARIAAWNVVENAPAG